MIEWFGRLTGAGAAAWAAGIASGTNKVVAEVPWPNGTRLTVTAHAVAVTLLRHRGNGRGVTEASASAR